MPAAGGHKKAKICLLDKTEKNPFPAGRRKWKMNNKKKKESGLKVDKELFADVT